MRRIVDHEGPRTAWTQAQSRRTVGVCVLPVLLAISIASLVGCGGKAQESTPPTPEPVTSAESESMLATTLINLNWDQQNSCVTFVPHQTTIHVGDRVNFNTNAPNAVTVSIPAGLFSASDTTISVSRGTNPQSPQALRVGDYPLSSNPNACPTLSGGSGPSIIVDAGDPEGR